MSFRRHRNGTQCVGDGVCHLVPVIEDFLWCDADRHIGHGRFRIGGK